MSIDNTRKFIEKAGCGHIFGIGIAIALLMGIFTQTWNQNNNAHTTADQALEAASVFAEVGGRKVSMISVQDAFKVSLENMRQPGPEGEPPPMPTLEQRAYAYGSSLTQVLQAAALQSLAEKAGFKFSDEEVAKMFSGILDEEFKTKRAEFVKMGKLKPDATDAEFGAMYKAQSGQSPDELRTRQKEDLARTAADPALKDQQRNFAAYRYLLSLERSKLKVTEEDVKANFTTYTVKTLNFVPDPKKPGGAEATAAKVAEEIKKGMTFEAAMDKYSLISAPAGKKKSEVTNEMPGALIEFQKELTVLRTLKPNDVSPVINTPGGPALYKMVAVKVDLPEDYKDTKDTLLARMAEQKASQIVTKQIEEFVADASNTKWVSPGIELAYEATKLLNSPMFSADSAEAMLAKFDALSPDQMDLNVVQSLRFAVASQALAMTQDALKKKKAETQFIEAARSALRSAEDPGLRIRMARVLLDQGNEEAVGALIAAAGANGDFGPQGQATHAEIYSIMDKLKEKKLLSPENEKILNDAQSMWKSNRERYMKDQAEAKAARAKDEAEAKARLDAERKAAEAEKKAAETKPPVTGGN